MAWGTVGRQTKACVRVLGVQLWWWWWTEGKSELVLRDTTDLGGKAGVLRGRGRRAGERRGGVGTETRCPRAVGHRVGAVGVGVCGWGRRCWKRQSVELTDY